MFNRLSLTVDSRELTEHFRVARVLEGYRRDDRYTPTRPIPVVYADREHLILDQYTWGIFPHWAKDSINAPSETIHEEPAYRRIFTKHRCIVPCDAFYRREGEGRNRRTLRFGMRDRGMIGIAAIYDVWKQPSGGEYRTCTLLTTAPNRLMSAYTERMPVILEGEEAERWLDPGIRSHSELLPLLRPFESGRLSVSAIVDNVKD